MAKVRQVYWDSGLFISLLSSYHPQEIKRADVVADLLQHAQNGDLKIWTSVWTMVEVIRPRPLQKQQFVTPPWADLLKAKGADNRPLDPNAFGEFQKVWNHFQRSTQPSRVIPDADAKKIRDMFDWPWINKIDVVPIISQRSAELMRMHNMQAGDAIHVASALHRNCDVIQHFDKDYQKITSLIAAEEPTKLTLGKPLTGDLFEPS